MVEEHIHKLLFEHDCVIIPDFGGLITHYAPARMHPVKNTLAPPAKRIAFNEKLQLNDGLLISTLAYDQKLSAEAAQAEVAAFVREMQASLQQHQRHELRGIGVFRYNAAHKLEFDYVPTENLLEDSFGLPELIIRPIPARDAANQLRSLVPDKQAEPTTPLTRLSWQRRLKKVYDTAAVVVIAGLSGTALYVLSLQTEYSQSSLNPFAVLNIAANTVAPVPTALESPFTEAYPDSDLTLPVATSITEPPVIESAVPAAALPTGNTPDNSPEPTTAVAAAASAESTLPAEPIENTSPQAKTLPAATLEVTAKPAEAPAKKLGVNIKEVTERYYVIAGGYSTLPKAEYSRKVANRYGAQGRIVFPFGESKLYRVSVADFSSKEEALVYLPKLKINYGKNIWILKY